MYIEYKGLRMEVPEGSLRYHSGGGLHEDATLRIRQIATVPATKPKARGKRDKMNPTSRLPKLQQPKCNLDVMRAVRSMGVRERLKFATS